MTPSKAKKYARGLADGLPDGADLGAIADELDEAVGAIDRSQLRDVLSNPGVSGPAKAGLVREALKLAGASPAVCHFLAIVAQYGDAAGAALIVDAVRQEADVRKGIVSAQIRTARPLADEDSRRLIATLERAVGKGIRASFETDTALLSGVVARVGDVVFDGSGRRQLERMREQLARASS